MKKMPGPRAPPLSKRPSLKMTTRSYSCTTLTAKQREKGSVTSTRIMEKKVSKCAHKPGPSSQAACGKERGKKKRIFMGLALKMAFPPFLPLISLKNERIPLD